MPHIIHVSVAAVSVVTFIVMAAFFVMAEVELNPISHNLLGMAHSKVELMGFAIRTIMTCVSVFVTNHKWMCIIQLILSVYLTYLYFYWVGCWEQSAGMQGACP